MVKVEQSKNLFSKACEYIPGGVNSPVRAFGAVGGQPVFIRKAEGAYLYDEDGNIYIDYVNAWGPMLLGHAPIYVKEAAEQALRQALCLGAPTRSEVELAELVCACMPSVEQLRMVNSGTEATFSAIRLARAYTQRPKIIKFAGCYHGHADAFLVEAGSGVATLGLPNSPGVPKGAAQDTLIARYNDLASVERLFAAYPKQVAALIVEPVAGNMGCVPPVEGFLQGLRSICDKEGALLIFDEVMTGFRLGIGGAEERFKVRPDLSTLGKVLGGGMPIGAFGGRKEIMQLVSPAGPVYQAGTFAGHPMTMACGLATLRHLQAHPEIYAQLDNRSQLLTQQLHIQAQQAQIPHVIQRVGSMFTLFFTEKEEIRHFEDTQAVCTDHYAAFFHTLLREGVYFPPSQLETAFISAAIDEVCMEKTLSATQKAFSALSKRR